jgi:hypothetical protein
MPTYNYGCDMCGCSQEVRRRVMEGKLPVCCLCGSPSCRIRSSGDRLIGLWHVGVRKRGPRIDNLIVDNCGVAVNMKQGGHMSIGKFAITKTPTGFDVGNGATVDVRNGVFKPKG